MSKAPSSTENLFANIGAKVAENTAPVTVAEPAAAAEPEVSETDLPEVSELDHLKDKARLMGIGFSNNIGVDALRAKIRAKLEGEPEAKEEAEVATAAAITEAPVPATAAPEPKVKSLRQSLRDSEMALVRLRITNLDPKKKDLHGEIFTFANRILGSVKKFVPYGEATDNGYHVPMCIYKQLRDRQFLQIKVRKINGQDVVETGWVREFALEVLPPLTPKQIADLKAAQQAGNHID